MDWVTTVVSSLITGGIGATFGTIYTARKNSQVGMSGNEVEASKAATADWSAVTGYLNDVIKRQDDKIEAIENVNNLLRTKSSEDDDYIDALQEHINLGLGPPAPKRTSK